MRIKKKNGGPNRKEAKKKEAEKKSKREKSTDKQTHNTQEIELTRMFFTSTARTTKLYDGRLAE
jgi:hypothetical protein